MSWASKRRGMYLGAIFLFFAVIFGTPLALWLYEPPSCFDGKRNQKETAIDKGGPCQLLDERYLTPHAILWSRSFQVRGGERGAVAYIENPNSEAGVQKVAYRFRIYDERNILVAVREGTTFIMPGGLTPVFEGAIDTGNRTVARTYFEFTDTLVWKHMKDATEALTVKDKQIYDTTTSPRLSAVIKNESVAEITNTSFVAVVFDTAGNAFAASETLLPRIAAGAERDIVFTWPEHFRFTVGRIDILPLLPPAFFR
ncbi:MAG: hypothetical protein UY39_C0027G0002 [Candidatus Kaiserbacteria bacterium GW2011_GWC2_49_12]|uniref:Uncharacterized protein n=4 Tax=Candidatus Kaiseribacteriota TaxID=1752734 RepID=A0A0G1WF22_9BACT